MKVSIKERLSKENRSYRPLHRRWPQVASRGIGWLMPLELIGLIPALVIFGIAQPDLYRTDLWRIGYEHGLNSDPRMILYAYANHRPLPTIPFIWSQTLTDFNVAISVVSLFLLLVKLITFIMKVWYPILAVFCNVGLVAIYAASTYGQIGPDYADPERPAFAAWYLRQGCEIARPYGDFKKCQIAQGSLAITLYMLTLYLLNLGFSIYAMWPNKANDVDEDDDEDEYHVDPKDTQTTQTWEMHSMKTPMSYQAQPFTPRTQAFHTLDRQLPLRQHQPPRFA